MFGRLTVVQFHDNVDGHKKYLCRCSCGNDHVVSWSNLKLGKTASCGCLRDEMSRNRRPVNRLPNDGGFVNAIRTVCVRWASKRGLAYSLTNEEFEKLVRSPCHYCGAVAGNTFRMRERKFRYNGIDRIDSAVGYVRWNCLSCCGTCNDMKGSLSYAKFADHVRKIAAKHPALPPIIGG